MTDELWCPVCKKQVKSLQLTPHLYITKKIKFACPDCARGKLNTKVKMPDWFAKRKIPDDSGATIELANLWADILQRPHVEAQLQSVITNGVTTIEATELTAQKCMNVLTQNYFAYCKDIYESKTRPDIEMVIPETPWGKLNAMITGVIYTLLYEETIPGDKVTNII